MFYKGSRNNRSGRRKRISSLIRKGMRLTGNAYVSPIIKRDDTVVKSNVDRPSLRRGGPNALGRAVYDAYRSLPSISDVGRSLHDAYYSLSSRPRRYLTNAAVGGALHMYNRYARRRPAIMQ